MNPSITIDAIIRSPRRTLGLEITREAKLIVRAPFKLPQEQIHDFISQKSHWIKRHQLRLKEQGEQKARQQWPAFLERRVWMNRYRYLAFTVIRARCHYYAGLHGLTFNEIKISGAKRRWGSCSPNGNLNFNWRLIFAPLEVIDYLVVHELAHLTVKNHSRIFWNRVNQMFPSYLKAEEYLKQYGYLLDI